MISFVRFVTLFAFFLQAFIPVGFMPVFAKDGPTITICSGITGESVQIQVDGNPSDDHGDKDISKCSYSVVGAYADMTVPALVQLNTSYIFIHIKKGDVFVAQFVSQSNLTRGPPHIFLT